MLGSAGEAVGVGTFFPYAFCKLTAFTALTGNTGLFLNFLKTDTSFSANIANFAICDLFTNTNVHKHLNNRLLRLNANANDCQLD